MSDIDVWGMACEISQLRAHKAELEAEVTRLQAWPGLAERAVRVVEAARAVWSDLDYDAEEATVNLGGSQRAVCFPETIPVLEHLGDALRAFDCENRELA